MTEKQAFFGVSTPAVVHPHEDRKAAAYVCGWDEPLRQLPPGEPVPEGAEMSRDRSRLLDAGWLVAGEIMKGCIKIVRWWPPEGRPQKTYSQRDALKIAFRGARPMSSKRRYSKRRFWTEAETQYVREHYADTPTAAIARHLNRPSGSVYRQAWKLGLAKSADYIRTVGFQPGSQIGAEYRFRPGQTPPNKGLRRPGWAPGRMAETQFKRGARTGIAARNWKPIGTILPDSEGYLRIKVREAQYGKESSGFGNVRVWPLYHRYLWEQANGTIPAGHLVVFRDGNRQNCTIENLELMTMADNARRNVMWNKMPRELAEVIQLQGALKRQLRRRENDATQHD